jgi:RHS repeat-associated protein
VEDAFIAYITEGVMGSGGDGSGSGGLEGAYRYGFNGQEKSNDVIEGNYTAEYWEYDSRIGRRWNVDPVTKEYESSYATFSNNPIYNIDPNGDSDSTYKTPGGGTISTETTTAETFDGRAYKVGSATVQPPKGTLRSFREYNGGEPGQTSRFVASFDKISGKFTGYVWDENGKDSYELFCKARDEDLADQEKNADNPVYEHYTNRRDALNSLINTTVGTALPTPILKYGTATANATKTVINAGKVNRFGIPKFYTYVAQGKRIFISPNAMKHLEELGANGSKLGEKYLKLIGQVYNKALQSSIDDVLSRGEIIYKKMYNSGGNEIMFGAPRSAGELPAVIHFR